MAQLRDQDENRNAAVAAARTIEGLIETTHGSSASIAFGRAGYVIDLSEPVRPGLQLVIVEREKAAPPPEVIDVTPNKDAAE